MRTMIIRGCDLLIGSCLSFFLFLNLVILCPSPVWATSSSSCIALNPNYTRLLVLNPESNSVSILDTADFSIKAELKIGADPRNVAIEDDGKLAVISNFGGSTLTVIDIPELRIKGGIRVGTHPCGVLSIPGTREFIVTVQGENLLLRVSASEMRIVDSIPVDDRPSGLAITENSEILLTHLLKGKISFITLSPFQVSDSISLWPDSNLVQAVSVSDQIAYVPHTRSNTSNRALTFDTTVFPIVSLIDIPTHRHLVGSQLALDTLDPPGVGLPIAATTAPDGSLWIVNSASNDLSIVDPSTKTRIAHIEVGHNPRGLVIAGSMNRVFVDNTLDGTISVIDLSGANLIRNIRVTDLPTPPAFLLGKQIFHSSADPRLARDQWISCSSCHFDGDQDGRTWNFGFAGKRNTTSLKGMIQTYPLRWSAEWDEAADSEFAITREQFGSGLLGGGMHDPLGEANTGLSRELDCLGAYLDSLLGEERTEPTEPDPSFLRGKTLFEDPVTSCSQCHPAPYWTDMKTHDVGTAYGPTERLGPYIDTPSLRFLDRSAPYLHDGSAETLRDVLTTTNPDDRHGVTSHLSNTEVDDLISYISRLPADNSALISKAHDLSLEMIPSHTCGRTGPPDTTKNQKDHLPREGEGRSGALVDISGRILSATDGAPLSGALVTIRATSIQARSDRNGNFRMSVPQSGQGLHLSAWSEGYYIASEEISVPSSGIELRLRPHHSKDNSSYSWVDPEPGPTGACGNCHPEILSQWQSNAHGKAISNSRFFSFYRGTNVQGTQSVSPGYLLDFPGTSGSCAACHVPGASIDAPFTTGMTQLHGTTTAGIHCDFCHKIGGEYLRPPNLEMTTRQSDGTSRRSYSNMPGIFSLKVLRPPDGDDVFFGPYADIHDPDTFLPIMKTSEFCAPCHSFSFWGTPIYTSYDEWRDSPYSNPKTGKSCQDCHMAPDGSSYFVPPDLGGTLRPPKSIPSHLQPGASDTVLLTHTIDLKLKLEDISGNLRLDVTLSNTGAGHHVPTDHPGRHMILLVEAFDSSGTSVSLLDGPTLPSWTGSRSGAAGFAFAKLLEDVVTGEWPVLSYWKPTLIHTDTRIPALASTTSTYLFPGGSGTRFRVRLFFRRVFEEIGERYGWDTGEILMAEKSVTAP